MKAPVLSRRLPRSTRNFAEIPLHHLSAEMEISPRGDYDVVIIGSGFGHEYVEHVKMHDISEAFEQKLQMLAWQDVETDIALHRHPQ